MRCFLLIVLGLFLLSGCATVSNLSSLDAASSVRNRGTVILALTSNFPDIGRFDVITLEAVDQEQAGQTYTVQPLRVPSRRSTNLFVFQLPPGHYRLRNVATGLPGTTHQYCQIRTDGHYDFDVAGDRLTDLGRLVVIRSGQSACDFARDFREPAAEAIVQRVWPDLSPENTWAANEATLGWREPISTQDRLKMLLALRITPGIFNPMVQPSGYLYAGSELGQVLVRSPSGHWHNVETDTSNTLLFVSPVNQQELVLVGELNTFLHLKDRKFSPVDTSGLPSLPLAYAGYHEGVGLVALLHDNDRLLVYKKTDFLIATWQAVSTLDVGRTFWGNQNTIIKARDNRIYIATTPDHLYVFDATSEQWGEAKLPGTPMDMSVSPDKEIIVLANDGWYKRNFLSLDDGNSWEPLNKGSVTQLAYVAGNHQILMLGEGRAPDLLVTKDKGEHWESKGVGKWGKLFADGPLALIFGHYDHAIAGNEVFGWNGSAHAWRWERTTNFEHNHAKLRRDLEAYFQKNSNDEARQ